MEKDKGSIKNTLLIQLKCGLWDSILVGLSEEPHRVASVVFHIPIPVPFTSITTFPTGGDFLLRRQLNITPKMTPGDGYSFWSSLLQE